MIMALIVAAAAAPNHKSAAPVKSPGSIRRLLAARTVAAAVVFLFVGCAESDVNQSAAQEPPTSEQSAAMDRLVSQMLEATGGHVPGVSVAVVVGEQPVYLRGFGKADVENNVDVHPDTPFYIASSTKSFTALAAALMERDGIIDLDAPVTRYAPDVSFAPALNADEVTIRHLLSHSSGFDNNAIVQRTAFTGEHTNELLRELLADTQPNARAPLGTFSYTNLGYNITGLFIDELTGKPWQVVLNERVFEPAGLANTTAYASVARSMTRPVAEPYVAFGANGSAERAYLVKQDNTMQAAGGMYTTAADAARWLILQLNDGMIDGEQVFPAEVIRATHEQFVSADVSYGPFLRDGYGLGWYRGSFSNDLAGERHIHHFGGFGGAHSHVSFLPERRIGVAVFVNESAAGGNLALAVSTLAYRLWLGRDNAEEEAQSFIQEASAVVERMAARMDADRVERAGRSSMLSQPFDAYAGTFTNAAFGTAVVTVDDSALQVRIGNLVSTSSPGTESESIRVELLPMRGEVIRFDVGPDGGVRAFQYAGATYTRRR